jgi:phosphoserine phosphatase
MLAPTPERLAELDTPDLMRKVTLFDLDGTKCTRQMTIELLLRISTEMIGWAEKIAPIRAAVDTYHRERTYDYSPVGEIAVPLLQGGLLKGLRERDVLDIAMRMMVELRSQRYIFTRTLMEVLARCPRSERGLIIAITGSPQKVAELFVADMGFDLVFGTNYRVEDGIYTGELDERSAVDKGAIVDELAERFKLNLASSMAVGDTASDIPMLERVGFPIAMNPNPELLAQARRRRYTVVYDRQKNGVTVFRPDAYGCLSEVPLQRIFPPYVKDFPSCLPEGQLSY